MKPPEIIDILNDFEKGFPVEKWVINGIHIWPPLRMQLYFEFFKFGGKDLVIINGEKNQAFTLAKSLLNHAYAYFADFKNNAKINNHANFIFSTYSVHRTLLNALWYDVFCEPFIGALKSLNMTSLVLERLPYGHKYRIPRSCPSVFIQARTDYLRIKNRILARRSHKNSCELDRLQEFINLVRSNYNGITIPGIKQLIERANLILDLAKYFERILKAIKPALVFIADYYNIEGFALNLACRRCGIRSIDIQHGGPLDYHAAYDRWHKIPKDGYELLPSLFWVWNESEKNIISKWSESVSNFHKPFVGGNLWHNMWRNDASDMMKAYSNRIAQLKAKVKKLNLVLFCLQPVYGISDWVLSAMQESQDSCCWFIRFHPTMPNKRKDTETLLYAHNIANFEIDQATDLPLTFLLKYTDVLVTFSSSTVIDAENFNVPSIILHPYGEDFFPRQISSGITLPAYTREELLKAIKSQVQKKKAMQEGQNKSLVNNVEIIKNFLSVIN